MILMSLNAYCQDYKYGKVSKEELLESSCSIDKAANAAVLYENKKITFEYDQTLGFQLVTQVHKRIKLYNKNGFDHASEVVYLYQNGGSEEKIIGLSGKTYILQGDEIVETKLKKESIFKAEDSKYFNKVTFTLPAIKEGAIIEYKYRIISPFYRSIDNIALQYRIPIKKIDVSLQIPEYYHFKKRHIGFLPIHLKESRGNDKIVFSGSTKFGQYTVRRQQYHEELPYILNNYDIQETNVPAFKIEPHSGNPNNYITGIAFELEYTKFPYSTITNYGTTWGAIARGAYKSSNFGGEIEKTKYFKADIDELIRGVSNPLQKTNLIYDYVKNRMTWNKRNSLTPRNGLKKPYQEKVGNSGEINLMLIGMLKYAGVKVNPVLVTTSDKPLSIFPTIQGLDHVVARVRINDDVLFLDATDKYGKPNVLPNRVIKGIGRLIAEKGNSEMILFRPKKISQQKNMVLCEINEEGRIAGKQRIQYSFYEARDFREENALKEEDEYITRLKDKYGLENVEEYKNNNIDDLEKPVLETFAFKTINEVEVIDGELFFSPLLFLKNQENIFKSDERKYPVDFGFGFSRDFSVSIKIPKGYEVVSKPEDIALALPENMGKFVFRTTISGNMIQVSVNRTLNRPLISSNYYSDLKEFYNQIVEKENEQIVLKKV